jgi:D-glycerate 3-kinase
MTYGNSFPRETHGLTDRELSLVHAKVADSFRRELTALQINALPDTTLDHIYLPLAAALARATHEDDGPLVVGVCGAQGSGKTTLCCLLKLLLEVGFGLRVTSFSIDDLYLTHAERDALGQTVHPLLTTRGVPGTHDVEMGRQLLTELTSSNTRQQIAIPVFDKSIDDRLPQSDSRIVETPFDIILFEGWCVAARPQSTEELQEPVNTLEQIDDPQGLWRNHVNAQLAGDYASLFASLDLLIMLAVPDMDCVFAWRGLQEEKLAARSQRADATKLMNKAALHRFIMHYERLTRHMLAEMPQRADLVLRLDRSHLVDTVKVNNWPGTKTI